MSTLQNFRTYELSIEFYKDCKEIKLPHAIRDQLMRAASSITLNLSEGAAKPSARSGSATTASPSAPSAKSKPSSAWRT